MRWSLEVVRFVLSGPTLGNLFVFDLRNGDFRDRSVPYPIFPQWELYFLSLVLPVLLRFVTAFLIVIFVLAVLLQCCALSVDVTSKFVRSYLELRQRLNVFEAFLE